jgi:hypothetical protein
MIDPFILFPNRWQTHGPFEKGDHAERRSKLQQRTHGTRFRGIAQRPDRLKSPVQGRSPGNRAIGALATADLAVWTAQAPARARRLDQTLPRAHRGASRHAGSRFRRPQRAADWIPVTRKSFRTADALIVVSTDGYFDVFPPMDRSPNDKPNYRGVLAELGTDRSRPGRQTVRSSRIGGARCRRLHLVPQPRRRRSARRNGLRPQRQQELSSPYEHPAHRGLVGPLPPAARFAAPLST